MPAPLSLISPVKLDERERENSFSKAAKRVLILWSVRNRQWTHKVTLKTGKRVSESHCSLQCTVWLGWMSHRKWKNRLNELPWPVRPISPIVPFPGRYPPYPHCRVSAFRDHRVDIEEGKKRGCHTKGGRKLETWQSRPAGLLIPYARRVS